MAKKKINKKKKEKVETKIVIEKEKVIEEEIVVNDEEEIFYTELGRIVGNWNGNIWNVKPYTTEKLKPFFNELGFSLRGNCGDALLDMYKILYMKYHKYMD